MHEAKNSQTASKEGGPEPIGTGRPNRRDASGREPVGVGSPHHPGADSATCEAYLSRCDGAEGCVIWLFITREKEEGENGHILG